MEKALPAGSYKPVGYHFMYSGSLCVLADPKLSWLSTEPEANNLKEDRTTFHSYPRYTWGLGQS